MKLKIILLLLSILRNLFIVLNVMSLNFSKIKKKFNGTSPLTIQKPPPKNGAGSKASNKL